MRVVRGARARGCEWSHLTGKFAQQLGDTHLVPMIAEHKDAEMQLRVYNAKKQEEREVIVRPRANWGGQGLLGTR